MKRSIGARIRSPSVIVHWTTRSQVDFDMLTHPHFRPRRRSSAATLAA
jgi:hypothetical protein